ncbi:Na,Li,K/H(+) antiporter subunit UmpB [Marinospirillum sp.]|uniref:Na,Li,K/H(+) antiporter subunit UmpB n=1 Tax=Marinospirillum sp. TaxID=2183934 RepID=UPI0028709DA9|nr:Na,Li,K/H(+) antiporter subunit UmpB [Marinospirillum sp.]MDR9467962.1 Na,Li,K/H(+) antiporter subunit UmpB [Marinospirillum sp.]
MQFLNILFDTLLDIIPIAAIIFGFQYLVIRKKVKRLPQVLIGFVLVLIGLSFFLLGLEQALFPMGNLMAEQLSSESFLPSLAEGAQRHWSDYYWIYIFAFAIGASTTIAEPSLIAVSIKAGEISGGTINPFMLRISVALGMAFGITLGTWRIVMGLPLQWLVLGAYILVIIQTLRSPKSIIPLAFDSGGVTTSTITVPIIAALGLGLASSIPGRSPVMDGFGMIALACLFPIITVMGYAQLAEWLEKRKPKNKAAVSSDR